MRTLAECAKQGLNPDEQHQDDRRLLQLADLIVAKNVRAFKELLPDMANAIVAAIERHNDQNYDAIFEAITEINERIQKRDMESIEPHNGANARVDEDARNAFSGTVHPLRADPSAAMLPLQYLTKELKYKSDNSIRKYEERKGLGHLVIEKRNGINWVDTGSFADPRNLNNPVALRYRSWQAKLKAGAGAASAVGERTGKRAKASD